jgi:hypothetical protein
MTGQEVAAQIHKGDKRAAAQLAGKDHVIRIVSKEGRTRVQVLAALPTMKDIGAQVCPFVHLLHVPGHMPHSFSTERTRCQKVGWEKMENLQVELKLSLRHHRLTGGTLEAGQGEGRTVAVPSVTPEQPLSPEGLVAERTRGGRLLVHLAHVLIHPLHLLAAHRTGGGLLGKKKAWGEYTKYVHAGKYLEYHIVCPLVRIGTSPPILSPASEGAPRPPGTKEGRGKHSPA